MKFRKRPVEITAFREVIGSTISTLEGDMHAAPGDWIIRGLNGELYPCKPDIFEKTYEPVDEEAKAEWEQAYGDDAAFNRGLHGFMDRKCAPTVTVQKGADHE